MGVYEPLVPEASEVRKTVEASRTIVLAVNRQATSQQALEHVLHSELRKQDRLIIVHARPVRRGDVFVKGAAVPLQQNEDRAAQAVIDKFEKLADSAGVDFEMVNLEADFKRAAIAKLCKKEGADLLVMGYKQFSLLSFLVGYDTDRCPRGYYNRASPALDFPVLVPQ